MEQYHETGGIEMKHQNFLIVIEGRPGHFSAYSPDLLGCGAVGKTREEVEQNMMEAMKLHIDGTREDGLKIPKSSSSALVMRLEVPSQAEAKERMAKVPGPNGARRRKANTRPHTTR